MTNLDDRYRLLKCVALGGGIRTHNAQDTSTGRPVMVHILDGADSEAVERLRGQVGALPTPHRSRILDISATDAGVVIVSEILSGLTSFQDWLDTHAIAPIKTAGAPAETRASATPESPARPKIETTESFVVGRIESSHSAPPRGVQTPGEFTQLFQGVEAAQPVREAKTAPIPAAEPSVAKSPPIPAAAPPAPKPVVPPAASPPPPPSAKPAASPPAAPPPAAPSSAPLRPGEFTSLFQGVTPPAPQHIDPSPLVGGSNRSSGPPGGAPLRPAAPPPPPLGGSSSEAFAAPPRSAPPPPSSAPPLGSLGMLGGVPPAPRMPLGAPPPSAPPPSPAPSAAAPGSSASPLLGAAIPPLGASGASNAPLPPVIPPPVFANQGAGAGMGSPVGRSSLADQNAAGPSDYTMLIRQSETPAPPVVKPAAPARPAVTTEPRRSIPLGLIIALNVVLVLAIALVLYFVFRPAPPNVTPGGPAPAVPTAAPSVKAPAVPSAPAVKAPAIPNAPAVKP